MTKIRQGPMSKYTLPGTKLWIYQTLNLMKALETTIKTKKKEDKSALKIIAKPLLKPTYLGKK